MDDMEIIRQYAIQILKHILGSEYTREYSTGIFRIIGGVFSILVGIIGFANSPDMILGFIIFLAIGVFLIFFGVKKVNSRNDRIKNLSGLIANYVISIKNQRQQRGLSPISTADIINFIQKTHLIYDDATVFDIDTKIFEGHSQEEISKMISEILHKNKDDQFKTKKESDHLIEELKKL